MAGIKSGARIFWCPIDDDGIARAREFCKLRGLGADDVRIVKRDKEGWGMMIEVEAKRDCRIVFQVWQAADA